MTTYRSVYVLEPLQAMRFLYRLGYPFFGEAVELPQEMGIEWVED